MHQCSKNYVKSQIVKEILKKTVWYRNNHFFLWNQACIAQKGDTAESCEPSLQNGKMTTKDRTLLTDMN